MTNSGKKILIIDDDKFLLDMYAVKFKECGFEVTLSLSGKDALKKISDGFSPDVILLDMIMPDMNGLEVLEKIHKEENAKSSAFIVLSNQGQPSDIEAAKKIGVDGYIIKSNAIPSEVLDSVKEIVAKKNER